MHSTDKASAVTATALRIAKLRDRERAELASFLRAAWRGHGAIERACTIEPARSTVSCLGEAPTWW